MNPDTFVHRKSYLWELFKGGITNNTINVAKLHSIKSKKCINRNDRMEMMTSGTYLRKNS